MSDGQDTSGKTTLYLRDPELRARLDAYAAAQGRSRNNTIVWILSQWLDQHSPVDRQEDR